MNIRQLFGFRVLVERVPEKTGRVLVPENAPVSYQLGRVVAVGDGRQPNGKVEPTLVEMGDFVWFQTNDQILATQSYMLNDNPLLNLHQGDLLARFGSPEMHYSNMEPLGRWVFVEPFNKSDSLIVLPEEVAEKFVYFKTSKVGARVDLPIEPGQELMVNVGRMGLFRMRRNSMEDDFGSYGYIDRDFILAAL